MAINVWYQQAAEFFELRSGKKVRNTHAHKNQCNTLTKRMHSESSAYEDNDQKPKAKSDLQRAHTDLQDEPWNTKDISKHDTDYIYRFTQDQLKKYKEERQKLLYQTSSDSSSDSAQEYSSSPNNSVKIVSKRHSLDVISIESKMNSPENIFNSDSSNQDATAFESLAFSINDELQSTSEDEFVERIEKVEEIETIKLVIEKTESEQSED
ncbi:MAG: hypothetical protein EXX96DRAFT_564666 [Benjaminiella poitrasii]|nr:MAG: hypothetical protein EXX96DRAFT_564666 [Benjaminiella poitrasii]